MLIVMRRREHLPLLLLLLILGSSIAVNLFATGKMLHQYLPLLNMCWPFYICSSDSIVSRLVILVCRYAIVAYSMCFIFCN